MLNVRKRENEVMFVLDLEGQLDTQYFCESTSANSRCYLSLNYTFSEKYYQPRHTLADILPKYALRPAKLVAVVSSYTQTSQPNHHLQA